MKKVRVLIKAVLPLLLVVVSLGVVPARADTYSWENLQSDIAGVAAHTDPNLVNPWGDRIVGGTIWVANNGTGTSTLYSQAGAANTLVVTIPASRHNREGANPTGTVFNSTAFFKVTKNGNSQPADSSS